MDCFVKMNIVAALFPSELFVSVSGHIDPDCGGDGLFVRLRRDGGRVDGFSWMAGLLPR